jgi:hypothetical protein
MPYASTSGVFSTARDVIPYLGQNVTVNSARNTQLWCVGISLNSGGGTRAEFDLPTAVFDTNRAAYRDAFVSVTFTNSYDGSSPTNPDFLGYLDVDSAECTPGSDSVRLSANTITSYLNKVWVGQNLPTAKRAATVTYPVSDHYGRAWKPLKVLQDLFGSGSGHSPSGGLPSYYRARVRLGNTSVLSDSGDKDSPPLVFRNTTYRDALDQIIAYYGDVAYRERFGGVITYLDFYRVNDASNPTTTARLGTFNDPIEGNTNIAAIQHQQTPQNTIDRVIGYGTPRRFMVSVLSAVPGASGTLATLGEPIATKAAVRDWTTGLQDIVKQNPKLAKQGYLNVLVTTAALSGAASLTVKSGVALPVGSILTAKNGEQLLTGTFTYTTAPEATLVVERGHNETTPDAITENATLRWEPVGVENTFRRYRLPDLFKPFTKLRENILRRTKDENGATLSTDDAERAKYKLQVWKYPTIRDNDVDGTFTGILQTTPVLLPNAHWDLERGWVILAEPALNELAGAPAENSTAVNITYQEAVVGFTFSFESPGNIYHDTGEVSGGDVSLDFAADGLTEQWQRDDLTFEQITNTGFPLEDSGGTDRTFNCVYFDEDDKNIAKIVTTAEIVKDDSSTLRAVCNDILREKNRRHHSYDIDLNYFTRGYRVGNNVRIEGQGNYVPGTYSITGIEYLTDSRQGQGTRLTVDNVKPPFRRSLRA